MSAVKDNLIAAKSLIDTPEKWAQHEYEPRPGCFCVIGAVGAVLGKDPDSKLGPEEVELARALPLPSTNPSFVIDFNDDEHTTHADIMALFDRAIAAQGDA